MGFEGEIGEDNIGGGSRATTSGGGGGDGSKRRKKNKLWLFSWPKIKESWRWKWRFLGSAFKWKRHALQLQVTVFEDVLFKIVSVLEAIVLVAILCFFYLCFGCHI